MKSGGVPMPDIPLLRHIPLTMSFQSLVTACKAASESLRTVCEIMPSLARNIRIMRLGTGICFSVNQNNISHHVCCTEWRIANTLIGGPWYGKIVSNPSQPKEHGHALVLSLLS